TYLPIIVGTIDTLLINAVVDATHLNAVIGSDRRVVILIDFVHSVIYAPYELSEQFGVSPWHWWSEVPIRKHSSLFALTCQHGLPSIKYRGLFINDEQPNIQIWAQAKFTSGTSQPFNHLFYEKLFELVLRIRANTLWLAIMFDDDDLINQATAHYFGVVMCTSHQEPMMRSSPNEFNLLYPGQAWDWWVNKQNITQYTKEGAQLAAPYILAQLYITVGKNNLYASQARYSTNVLADAAEELFKNDYTLEKQYNTMLN
ncbi:hypothetical protein FRB99_003830, partial [Tulasnella sp. 403]